MSWNPRILLTGLVLCLLTIEAFAETADPSQAGYAGRIGTKIYVSKLGDDSDGKSWETAFNTIQQGINAVPDDKGGHCVIVRPDVYVEANLAPSQKGAKGAYNTLICDYDGSLGSKAKGWAMIDSGDPKLGFKSWDWWSTIRASDEHWPGGNNQETFSSIVWDRWTLRRLYTSGGDAGFFWDLTSKSGEGFTVQVEDCVGIGRAFGGGVVYPQVRPDEPSTFRRCYFLALDWVGDTAAVLVGGSEDAMPEHPHVVLEDCTLVHSDNAIAISYAAKQTRVKLIDCRLIALNFTQPEMGGKSTGIICTEGNSAGGALHVDLQDCRLAGYSVFTPGPSSKLASYTMTGRNTAYLQFKQELPEGLERVGVWPADLFSTIAPPPLSGAVEPHP
ncbi:MAG: hypothetical protein WDZ51_06990 [Pirellulaceae bacterium]